jgi:hypothetical protein
MPAETLQAASAVSASLATLQSLLGKDAGDAQTLLASLPVAIQRIESSAWRDDLPSGTAAIGETYAQALENLVNSVSTGVHIVSPSTGVYTLASNNSPLPITVENDLRYSVRVRIKVTTVNGLPGFTAKDIGSQPIEPNSKKTVQLPTTVDRSGRIQVQAELLTPGGDLLGTPVILSVHSTALGAIGVIITIVAGIVLALALLVRLIRRFRKRGRGGTTPKPGAGAGPPTTDPVPSPVPAQEPAP